MKHYARVATTGSTTIKKGGTNKQTLIECLTITATTTGTIVISDGSNSYTIDVIAGINTEFCHELVFDPGTDVTFTVTGPTASIFVNYTYK